MTKLFGNIDAKLDAKGRVFIPAFFRKILLSTGDTTIVLRKGNRANCLKLFPYSYWEQESERLREKLNRNNVPQEDVYRYLHKDIEIVDIDASGRILLSKSNLQSANIKGKDVRFLGMGDNIEIWGIKELEERYSDEEKFQEEIEKYLA